MQLHTGSYRRTITACFIGYVAQAAICTLAPLLYVQFRSEFALSLDQIALMITVTFFTQLLVDLTSSPVVARLGCRACIVAAHLLVSVGFALMSVLPDILPSAYAGLMISAIVYSLIAAPVGVVDELARRLHAEGRIAAVVGRVCEAASGGPAVRVVR